MSLRVVHSPVAARDLDTIAYRISEGSPGAAFRWLEQTDHTMHLISQHPGLGEAVDHLGSGIRRISLGS